MEPIWAPENQDPLSNNMPVTNMSLLETEHRVFTMLRVKREQSKILLPRNVGGDMEPIWADKGLGWTIPAYAALGAYGLGTQVAETPGAMGLLPAPRTPSVGSRRQSAAGSEGF